MDDSKIPHSNGLTEAAIAARWSSNIPRELAILLSPSKRERREVRPDRFIPTRSYDDPAQNFQIARALDDNERRAPKRKASATEDAFTEEAAQTYRQVLRSEIIGPDPFADKPYALPERNPLTSPVRLGPTRHDEFIRPSFKLNHIPDNNATQPTRRLLHFAPPKSSPLDNVGLPKVPKPKGPFNEETINILTAPRRKHRSINRIPYKVLDAPDLADDFYLNLLDWGSADVLGVGLGTCVYLWSAANSRVTKLCDVGPYDAVTAVNWHSGGQKVAIGTNRGHVKIYDKDTCQVVTEYKKHENRVGTLAWIGDTVSSGSRDRSIVNYDTVSGQSTSVYKDHKQEVCGLKWNESSHNLASGGNDNRLLIWDRRKVDNNQPMWDFRDHTAAVKAMDWSPHQYNLLASGGGTADRRIRFWNISNGTCLNSIDTQSQVCNVAWSKNSPELVSTHGYSLNQVIVWSYPRMSSLATLTGHTMRVLYLATSPDGTNIATGAGDETLRFWNIFDKPKKKADTEGWFYNDLPVPR